MMFNKDFSSRAERLRRGAAFLGLAIGGWFLFSTAHASSDDICAIGDPANAAFGLAKIGPSNGADLRKVEAPCPDDSDGCRSRIHLKANERVLTTGRVNGPYVCVYRAGAKTNIGGYVKQTDIEPLRPPRPLPLTAWSGIWRDFDDWIKLRVAGTALAAEGEAFWPGAHPSPKERPGGPNTGDMSGVATPRANIVVFADPGEPDGCRVIAALDKSDLLVSDNGNCGGANVSFSGLYHRGKGPK